MQMIPFKPKPLAERKAQVSAFNAALVAGVSSGFPSVSIKGKVFHLVRGDDRTLITKPGEDDPAASIEVVLLNANPNLSRTYYAKSYEEGSDAKPDCYSNDGKTPAADSGNPQAKSCATCPHSQYGSRISDNGTKGWACANFRRMAIAMPSALDDPMLIRVPGGSLKALVNYARELDGHGYQFNEVVTKIGFDYSVAHPALTFKAIAAIPEEHQAEVLEVAGNDLVAQIIGVQEMPSFDAPAPAEPTDAVANLPKKTAAKASKPAPKASAALDKVVTEAEAQPITKPVKVEDAPETEGGMLGSLDDMLSGVSFDD